MSHTEAYTPVGILKSRRSKGCLNNSQIDDLIREYQSCHDINRQRELEEQVVSTHLLGVLNAISKYSTARHEETLSLAYFAIKKAMQKYHPGHKANFLTYARLWARHEAERHAHDEEFELFRRPVEHHERYRSYRRIEAALQGRLGRQPSIEEVLSEGLRQCNAYFLKGKKPMQAAKLESFLSESMASVIRIDDEILGKSPKQAMHGGANPLHLALLSELRREIDGLFDDYFTFITKHLGFIEAEIILEHQLLHTYFADIGRALGISRQQTDKLANTLIPQKFAELGLPSTRILGPLAAMTALVYECLNEPLPRALERYCLLNPDLPEMSLNSPLANIDMASTIKHLRLDLERTERQTTIISQAEIYTPFNMRPSSTLPSVSQRIELGKKSDTLPKTPMCPNDLLRALRTTLCSNENQTQLLYPHGRRVLCGLYNNPRDKARIHTLLDEGVHGGDITLFCNDLQGEAIKFWPNPKVTSLN